MLRDAKHMAYELYIEKKHSMTAIAQKLNIHHNTIRNWAQQGNWREIRTTRTARPARLSAHYLQQCCEILANINKIEWRITMQDIEVITRLMNAAAQMDKEIHIGMQAHALKKFGLHLMNEHLALSKQFNNYKMQFIRDVINSDQKDIPALMPHVDRTDILLEKSDSEPAQN